MKKILFIIACLLSLDSLAEEQEPVYHNFYCDTICIQTQALNENIISNKTLGGFPLFDSDNVIEINGGLYDDIVRVVQLYLNVDKRVKISICSLGRIVVWPNIHSHLLTIVNKGEEVPRNRIMLLINEMDCKLKSIIVVAEYLYGDDSLDIMYTKRRRNKFMQMDRSLYSDNIIESQGISKRLKDRKPFFVFQLSKEGYIIKQ